MNKLQTLRKIMAIISIVSIIDIPFIYATEKDEEEDKDEKFAKNIGAIGSGAAQMYNMYTQQKIQNAQMLANVTMMNKLGPGCMQNGKPCHITPAKYFPECPITNSMVNFPKGMCESPSMNPNQIEQMSGYKQLANNWVNQFEHMLNPAQNSSFPVGLKCLADKQAALNQQLQNTENSLTALQTQLKKDLQVFRENNKKILEELDTNNKELFGTGGNKNNADKLRNLRNYFSQSCQNVIGKENFQAMPGLNDILKMVTNTNSDATNYLSNRNAIEADIKRALEKVNNKIKNEGVASIETGTIDIELGNLNPATLQVLNKIREEYKLNRSRIETQIKEVQPDYKLPRADNNFSEDTAEFISSAETQFKKQYINDCVSGKDLGVAIPLENVLSSLQQKSTGSAGNARDKYRSALKAIVESTETVDQKLQRIKDLESSYSDITITYQNQQSLRVTQTPHQLYMDIAKACETRYTTVQSETSSTAGTSNSSQKKKVDRAVNLIKEYKSLNETFSAKLTQAVNEQVLNCSGSAKKSEDGSCSKAMDRNNESFCIAHANQCAGEIQSCYLEADKQVKTRETKMKALANTFNANMTALIARSNQLYDSQKAQVQNLVGYMQQRFPGTQFELPKDMFVALPESGKSDYFGVNLIGGNQIGPKGELKFLEDQTSLIGKIDKFKEMIKSQRESTNDLLKNYIDNQSNAMAEQREKWNELSEKCNQVYMASKAQVEKYNQAGQEAQAKAQNAAGQFCKRFKNWKKNPNPGCNKALFSALEAVGKDGGSSYANDGALEAASTMKDLCEENQSEIAEARKENENNKITMASVCSSTDSNDEKFLEAVGKQFNVKISIGEKSENSDGQNEELAKKIATLEAQISEKEKKASKEEASIKDLAQDRENLAQLIKQQSTTIGSAKSLASILANDDSFSKFLKENSKLNKKQQKFFEELRGYAEDKSVENKNICAKVAGKEASFEKLKTSSLNSTLNDARKTPEDQSAIAAQLKAIGEDAKDITCEAGSSSGRNIFKDLFSTPTALQNLGIGGTAQ